MNKLKLARIIEKDLEEIRLLCEEVAESEDDSTLIIDLALSRARLLCQEFELLRELATLLTPLNQEAEEDFPEEEDDEVSDLSFSDPELEILNFEENEFPEEEELAGEDESIDEEESIDGGTEDEEKVDWEEDKQEDLIQEEEEDEDDLTEDEDDEDDNEDEDEDDLSEEEEEEVEEEETLMEVEDTEIENEPTSRVREILIEEMDDELEPVKFSPPSGSSSRPVMHEIPKPENPVQEKMVVGESFHKERSVNDVISENKSNESNINNGPISSLRAAIGLNDRFIFIREIFDNNTDKYNTLIDQLDKLETIQQAVELLKANLTLQKNETSLKFVDLLKRRFSK